MIRVLFAIESLQLGGAEKSLVTLLGNLDYDKMNVDLLIFSRGGILEKYVPRQVKIINGIFPSLTIWDRVRYRTGKMIKYGNIHEAQLFWKIARNKILPISTNYDVAIAYNQQFATYFVAEFVNAHRKFSWMNTLYNSARYNARFDRAYFEKFNAIVAVSSNAENELMLAFQKIHFPLKTIIIKDVIECDTIATRSLETPAIQFSSEFINIVTVCRLDVCKGLHLAVGAAQILMSSGLQFRWYIVGEGSERAQLEKMILSKGLSKFVILAGATDNPYPYMRACDIYVQTSLVEGLGMTVIEAVVLQKPVVCTNFETAQGLVTKDDIITEKCPIKIAEGITTFIENPDRMKRNNNGSIKIEREKERSLQEFNKLLFS